MIPPATADQSYEHRREGWRWLFSRRATVDTASDIILWWEARRGLYNVLIFVGWPCAYIALVLLQIGAGVEPAFPDALAIFAIPFVLILVNMAYTIGWIAELSLRFIGIRGSGPLLLKLGVGFTLFLMAFPVVVWFVALVVIRVSERF